MPGTRPYQALDADDELDDVTAWVSVLGLFEELTTAQQIRCLLALGERLYEVRQDSLVHLHFYKDLVHRALSLDVARPDE